MHAVFREISAGCSIPLVEEACNQIATALCGTPASRLVPMQERAMLLSQLNVVISCIFQGFPAVLDFDEGESGVHGRKVVRTDVT